MTTEPQGGFASRRTSARHRLRNWGRYVRGFGAVQALRLIALECVSKAHRAVEMRTARLPHPVALRLNTSDTETFDGVIRKQEYDVALATAPRVIVDAGANIGLAAVWFASRYPEARVIALEPEASNFEMLCRNAAPYPGIVPVRAALWSSSGTIGLTDPGTGHWGFRTVAEPVAGNGVEAICIPDLLERFGIDHIDLLKMDVEGAEREAFSNCAPWIERTRVIAAELHEHLAPGATQAFEAATAGFAVQWRQGENHFVARAGQLFDRPARALA